MNLKIGMKVTADFNNISWIGNIIEIKGNNITLDNHPTLGIATINAGNITSKAKKKRTTFSISNECIEQIEKIQKKLAGDNKFYVVPATNIIEKAVDELYKSLYMIE